MCQIDKERKGGGKKSVVSECTGVCSGFHDSRAPCRLALLLVGVSASFVGGRAVGTGAGTVAVREQSVSLISPPRPKSTIALLCLSPPSPWQHHMTAPNVGIAMLLVCVCVCLLAQSRLLSPSHC